MTRREIGAKSLLSTRPFIVRRDPIARQRNRIQSSAGSEYDTAMSAFTTDEAAACRRLIELALAEDLGTTGDRTSLATIPAGVQATAAFVARSPGVLAGLPAATLVCHAVDPAYFHPDCS